MRKFFLLRHPLVRNYTKEIRIGFTVLLVFIYFDCAHFRQQNRQPKTEPIKPVQKLIHEVQQVFAPDARLAVFNIQAKKRNGYTELTGEATSSNAVKHLLKRLDAAEVAPVVNRIRILPAENLESDTCAVVRISVAGLYREPDIRTEMVNQSLMGRKVRLLKRKRGIYLVQLEDGYLGWMSRSGLAIGDVEFLANWQKRDKVIVTGLWGLIRTAKHDTATVVSDIVAGNVLALQEFDAEWTRVALPDGRSGFIKNSLFTVLKEWRQRQAPSPDDILRTARQLMGFPYVWGGTSIKGMDCSGFTYTTFFLNGITLLRDANMQANMGTPVSIDDNFAHLKPADLLFFGPDSNRITHVGIYSGDYRFIHSEGYVHQNSFNPNHTDYHEYRVRTLRKARRIIN